MIQLQQRIGLKPAERIPPRGAPHVRPGRLASSDRSLSKTIMLVIMDGWRSNDTAATLRAAGYDVRLSQGLPDALASINLSPPALIVVCGRPATHTYLALRHATAAPILALLMSGAEADLLEALNVGADDCQPASIGAQELLMRVRTLLRRGERQRLPNGSQSSRFPQAS